MDKIIKKEGSKESSFYMLKSKLNMNIVNKKLIKWSLFSDIC